MVEITVSDLIKVIPKLFIRENAVNVNANFQIIATGQTGGEWGIKIMDQTCEIESGIIENPDYSLIASAEDLLKIFFGELDPLKAFMQGKIQFKGRINKAMELSDLFTMDRKLIERLIS